MFVFLILLIILTIIMPEKTPGLFLSLTPVIFLIIFLSINVTVFDDTLSGSNQVILLLAAGVATIITLARGKHWNTIQKSIVKNIGTAMPAILILLMIGSLAGTWLLSGVVPAMIYYGLNIVQPKLFLFTAVIVSGIVALATGSSWSTIATIGVALLGIGKAVGIPEPMVAGAIISGAYFGDKMSPLSDTTNLAPAVAGTDLFVHIRYMLITTVPALTLALIIYLIIGFTIDMEQSTFQISEVQQAIKAQFNLSPWLFLVPLILFAIIIKKTPPLPALLIGTLLGALAAIIFQSDIVTSFGTEGNGLFASYEGVMKAMFGDISIHSDNEVVSELFATGGMAGMLPTVWLILSAMVFGGTMDAGGMLKSISAAIIKMAKSTTSLIASTAGSCLFFNITASDQYIAIVVPGKMYAQTFRERGYKPEVLSRTLEDSGTVTSVLIPWNTGGATQARVLGVPTLSYLPYCFFNILSPIMAVIIASLNYKIRRYADGEIPSDIVGEEV